MLTETWLKASVDTSAVLGFGCETYVPVRCDRPRKVGGGVLFLIKPSSSYEIVFSEAVPDSYEILCCDITLGDETCRFIGVYRAPSCSSCKNSELVNTISDLAAQNVNCILTGDFYYPDIEWASSKAGSKPSAEFFEMCATLGFSQLVMSNTRGNHTLDLVLCNKDSLVQNVTVKTPIGTSDHSVVKFTVKAARRPSSFRPVREFCKANYGEITSFLRSIDWIGSLSALSTVDEMYEMFIAVLKDCIETFVPCCKKPAHQCKWPRYLISLAKIRELAFRESILSPSTRSTEHFKTISRRFCKKLKKFSASLEKKISSSSNSSDFFRMISTRLKSKQSTPAFVDDTGKRALTNKDKAELLAQTFEAVFQKPQEEGNLSASLHWDHCAVTSQMKDSFWFHEDTILKCLLTWPKSRSRTPDEIPLFFIQKVAHEIVSPLQIIYNLRLRGEVAWRWKEAFLTPLPKKPPFNNAKNYRPISITSVFAGLFEKLLREVIVAYLENNSVIPLEQICIRGGGSTTAQMSVALNYWTTSLENGSGVDVIYFDFEKAFDKVPHSKLIKELSLVGLHQKIVKWIESFLDQRVFRVNFQGQLSSTKFASSGVPQGSVLSPILFNVYTREIPSLVNNTGVTCQMFADDLKVYSCVSDPTTVEKIQAAISEVVEWAKSHQLPLAGSKTKVLHLGKNNKKASYFIEGQRIVQATEVKDLGFIITENLEFDNHCNDVAAKASRRVCNLFRSLSTNEEQTFLRAYKMYVRPLLEYGTPVFGPTKVKNIEVLEKVQNSFTRKHFLVKLFCFFSLDREDLGFVQFHQALNGVHNWVWDH